MYWRHTRSRTCLLWYTALNEDIAWYFDSKLIFDIRIYWFLDYEFGLWDSGLFFLWFPFSVASSWMGLYGWCRIWVLLCILIETFGGYFIFWMVLTLRRLTHMIMTPVSLAKDCWMYTRQGLMNVVPINNTDIYTESEEDLSNSPCCGLFWL